MNNAPSTNASVARWMERKQIATTLPLLRSLPSMPESHQRILVALNEPNYAAERVAHLISEDFTLTAQLLKTVNSPLFGLAQPVSDVEQAVSLVGTNRLRALVSSAWAFHFIEQTKVCPGFNPRQEWDHALEVGMETQRLAMTVNCSPELGQFAFTAGMLHDLGKIVLAANLPDRYGFVMEEAKRSSLSQWEAEMKTLGFHHGEIGACLLNTWGFDSAIIEAVGWHHQPGDAPEQGLSALTLVHLADCNVRGIPPYVPSAEVLAMNARPTSLAERRKSQPSH